MSNSSVFVLLAALSLLLPTSCGLGYKNGDTNVEPVCNYYQYDKINDVQLGDLDARISAEVESDDDTAPTTNFHSIHERAPGTYDVVVSVCTFSNEDNDIIEPEITRETL